MEAERQQRQREQKLFAELEKKEQELKALKSTTESILANGWDINTLTTHKLNQEPNTAQISQIENKVSQLEARLADREAQLAKKEQLADIRSVLQSNQDDYELIAVHGAEHKVQELIDHYYENEKKLLTIPEAAKAIEAELERYERSKAAKLAGSKKGKEIYNLTKGGTVPSTNKSKAEAAPKADTPDTPSKPKPYVPSSPVKPNISTTRVSGSAPTFNERQHGVKQNQPTTKQQVLERIVATYGQNVT